MIRSVSFRNKGQKIIGVLHVPDRLSTREKAPGVVMFHGFTGHKAEAHRFFVQVANALCNEGYVVLRFDFRCSGDSEGEFEDMTVPGEVSDAKKSMTFLGRQKSINRARIGVIGLSMGGRVASILASKDKRVKFVVLYSAALSPLKKRFMQGMTEEALKRLDRGEAIPISNGWYLKKPFFATADKTVPLRVMHKIKTPVLIVHGDGDMVVPIDDAHKGYEAIKTNHPRNELYIVKGGDHTFQKREHTHEVSRKTLEWLRSLALR